MIDLVENYKELHMIPEVGFKEYKTQEYLKMKLSGLNAKIYELKPTGLIVYFDFESNCTIAFRAELDGLPIFENNEFVYKSKINGYMHACGHDANMSILLSLCSYINQNSFKANICCIFQPSEETFGGANLVVNSSIFNSLGIKKIYAIHFWPNLPKGKVYSRPGLFMASANEIDIEIYGKSSHVLNKDAGIDSIIPALKVLEKVKSSNDCLFNCGVINSFGKRNIVCEKTRLECTLRTFSNVNRIKFLNELKNICKTVCKDYNVKTFINDERVIPSLTNDYKLFMDNRKLIDEISPPIFASEDFSTYGSKADLLFLLIGTGKSESLHSSTFNIDLDLLDVGLNLEKNLLRQYII